MRGRSLCVLDHSSGNGCRERLDLGGTTTVTVAAVSVMMAAMGPSSYEAGTASMSVAATARRSAFLRVTRALVWPEARTNSSCISSFGGLAASRESTLATPLGYVD